MKTKSLLAWSTGIATAAAVIGTRFSYRRWKLEQVERLHSESHLLDTARGTVEYQMEGDGPVVMMLHGSPGGYDQGMALARFLDLHSFTVLTLSRPGYRRTPLSSGATPEAQADLFASALDALNVPQVAIITLSGGGPAALQFALRYPQRCRRLLMLSALTQHYTEEGVYRSLPPGRRWLKRLFDATTVFDPFLYLLNGLRSVSLQGARLSALASASVMNHRRTTGYRNDMQQFADLPTYPVQDIAVPTLIVHGTADVDIPCEQAKRLAKKMPQAQLVVIEGADHFFTLTSAKAVAAIRTFLERM